MRSQSSSINNTPPQRKSYTKNRKWDNPRLCTSWDAMQVLHRNQCGQPGHGLTTLLTCYYKAKLKVRWVMSLSHHYAIACAIGIATPWSVYCRASSDMSDAAVAVHPNCSSAQHSKVTHSLHKHLAWPLQFCFVRLCYLIEQLIIHSLIFYSFAWFGSCNSEAAQGKDMEISI